MAGQVAAHLDNLALVAQVILQARRRPKARTVVEVLTPAHTPEQVAVVVVRQALRVALDQGSSPGAGGCRNGIKHYRISRYLRGWRWRRRC